MRRGWRPRTFSLGEAWAVPGGRGGVRRERPSQEGGRFVNDGDSVQAGPGGGAGFPYRLEGADIEWTRPGPDMLREILTDLQQLD